MKVTVNEYGLSISQIILNCYKHLNMAGAGRLLWLAVAAGWVFEVAELGEGPGGGGPHRPPGGGGGHPWGGGGGWFPGSKWQVVLCFFASFVWVIF